MAAVLSIIESMTPPNTWPTRFGSWGIIELGRFVLRLANRSRGKLGPRYRRGAHRRTLACRPAVVTRARCLGARNAANATAGATCFDRLFGSDALRVSSPYSADSSNARMRARLAVLSNGGRSSQYSRRVGAGKCPTRHSRGSVPAAEAVSPLAPPRRGTRIDTTTPWPWFGPAPPAVSYRAITSRFGRAQRSLAESAPPIGSEARSAVHHGSTVPVTGDQRQWKDQATPLHAPTRREELHNRGLFGIGDREAQRIEDELVNGGRSAPCALVTRRLRRLDRIHLGDEGSLTTDGFTIGRRRPEHGTQRRAQSRAQVHHSPVKRFLIGPIARGVRRVVSGIVLCRGASAILERQIRTLDIDDIDLTSDGSRRVFGRVLV